MKREEIRQEETNKLSIDEMSRDQKRPVKHWKENRKAKKRNTELWCEEMRQLKKRLVKRQDQRRQNDQKREKNTIRERDIQR